MSLKLFNIDHHKFNFDILLKKRKTTFRERKNHSNIAEFLTEFDKYMLKIQYNFGKMFGNE